MAAKTPRPAGIHRSSPADDTRAAYTPERGERVAILLCGANTDPSDL
jgi:hypothetical protein